MTDLTKAERQRNVDQMNANFRLDDMFPDDADLSLQRRYIDGEISLDALLTHAKEFTLKASGA